MESRARFRRIRLLRKKLQQIEHLKLLSRDLNDEELAKVEKEDKIRNELTDLLLKQQTEESLDRELDENMVDTVGDADVGDADVGNAAVEDLGGAAFPDISKAVQSNSGLTEKKTSQPAEEETGSIQQKSQRNTSDSTQRPKPTAPSKQPSSVSKASKAKPVDPEATLRSAWRGLNFDLVELSGHSDITLSVDVNEQYIVSGSRDTTVKVWSCESLDLLQNLGGHTGVITAVKLVTPKSGKTETCGYQQLKLPTLSIERNIECVCNVRMVDVFLDDGEILVVSGSDDCSIRLWQPLTGAFLCESYTYNTVQCLHYLSDRCLLVAGLDGGKINIYRLTNELSRGRDLLQLTSHSLDTDRVTCLDYSAGLLGVGGVDGAVFVLDLSTPDDTSHSASVKCLYSLESDLSEDIKCLAFHDGNTILVGDDNSNIRVISWRTNKIFSLANHCSEFGVTDSLEICSSITTTSPQTGSGNYLLSSAYDYDTGTGYINVRNLSNEKFSHVTSISDPDIRHILAMSATTIRPDAGVGDGLADACLLLVTAGVQLVVWKQVSVRSAETVSPVCRRLVLVEDGATSDSEDYDAQDSDSDGSYDRDSNLGSQATQTGGWLSWCSIL